MAFGNDFASSSVFKQEASMSRKPRLEFPGAIYHIHHRGNHQEYIYLDDDDRKLFLKLLKTTIQRMNWICHAYCLMGNHYHLLIEIPDGIISRGMAWLNGVYTQKFNRKYEMSGHLFQGRFKSKPVEDNMQFITAAMSLWGQSLWGQGGNFTISMPTLSLSCPLNCLWQRSCYVFCI